MTRIAPGLWSVMYRQSFSRAGAPDAPHEWVLGQTRAALGSPIYPLMELLLAVERFDETGLLNPS